MSTRVTAPTNHKVLAWARAESGYHLAEAAAKLGQSAERLTAWESGEERPTLRQAEGLAALYHRPLPVLFLSAPPTVIPLAMEFRRLPGVRPGEESPELRVALRSLRRRREIALDLMEENEEAPPDFTLAAHHAEAPEDVGQRLRAALGVTIHEQQSWRDEYQAWRTWRDRAEGLGLLVFQVPGIRLSEMRGVGLLRDPLPVVGVNSKDHPLARIFTLFHEVCHLMLRKGGDERAAAEETRKAAEWTELERFADSVAAATLMPRDLILGDPAVMGRPAGAQWSTDEITRAARRYRASPVAFLTRLATLQRVTWPFYKTWRAQWEEKWEKRPRKETEGGPSRVETILSRVGPTYAALVLDSLARDLITPLFASDALDLKVRHFDRLKSTLLGRGAAPAIGEASDE